MPSEIGRIQAGINLGYFEKNEHVNEIVINHSVPDTFAKSLKYSVGFTFWETNRLPTDWVRDCNNMDEIWTCSKAMQEVFINSGITKPVHEFKLGVDPELYFPVKRTPHRQFTCCFTLFQSEKISTVSGRSFTSFIYQQLDSKDSL